MTKGVVGAMTRACHRRSNATMPSPHRLLFTLDAERAHGAAMAALRAWGGAGVPLARTAADPILATSVAGIEFANPVLLAAGLDKDGRAIRGLAALGFGGVEVGTLTLRPQSGQPAPAAVPAGRGPGGGQSNGVQ